MLVGSGMGRLRSSEGYELSFEDQEGGSGLIRGSKGT